MSKSDNTESQAALPIGLLLIIVLVFSLMLTGCTRYDGTNTQILRDLDIDFEITRNLPAGADGFMDPTTGKVYVKPGKLQVALVLHEAVHMLRSDARVMGDHYLEEIIACRAAYHIGRIAGVPVGVNRYSLKGWEASSVRVNGFEHRILNAEEEEFVSKEVTRSIQLVEERLAKKGMSMTEIDWVKTAILLLL